MSLRWSRLISGLVDCDDTECVLPFSVEHVRIFTICHILCGPHELRAVFGDPHFAELRVFRRPRQRHTFRVRLCRNFAEDHHRGRRIENALLNFRLCQIPSLIDCRDLERIPTITVKRENVLPVRHVLCGPHELRAVFGDPHFAEGEIAVSVFRFPGQRNGSVRECWDFVKRYRWRELDLDVTAFKRADVDGIILKTGIPCQILRQLIQPGKFRKLIAPAVRRLTPFRQRIISIFLILEQRKRGVVRQVILTGLPLRRRREVI